MNLIVPIAEHFSIRHTSLNLPPVHTRYFVPLCLAIFLIESIEAKTGGLERRSCAVKGSIVEHANVKTKNHDAEVPVGDRKRGILFRVKNSFGEEAFPYCVEAKERAGQQQGTKRSQDWHRNFCVLAFPFDEANVVTILKKDPERSLLRKESIARQLNRCWEAFDSVRLLVGPEFFSVHCTVSIAVSKRRKLADLEHCKAGHICREGQVGKHAHNMAV